MSVVHAGSHPCRQSPMPARESIVQYSRNIFRIPSAPSRKKWPSSYSTIKKIYHTRTQSIQLDLLLCSSRTAWSTIVLEMAMELRVFWKQWVVSANDTVRIHIPLRPLPTNETDLGQQFLASWTPPHLLVIFYAFQPRTFPYWNCQYVIGEIALEYVTITTSLKTPSTIAPTTTRRATPTIYHDYL